MTYNDYTYAVCATDTELQKIDFSQVFEVSASSCRRSLDNSQFLIHYSIEPTFISNGTVIATTMNHELILALMETPEWTPEQPE